MAGSAVALALGLAALVAARAGDGVRRWWRAAAWALAALLLAWLVGYATLLRGADPALLLGVPTLRPLAVGGWSGGALALAGALRAWTRPGRRDAGPGRAPQLTSSSRTGRARRSARRAGNRR